MNLEQIKIVLSWFYLWVGEESDQRRIECVLCSSGEDYVFGDPGEFAECVAPALKHYEQRHPGEFARLHLGPSAEEEEAAIRSIRKAVP